MKTASILTLLLCSLAATTASAQRMGHYSSGNLNLRRMGGRPIYPVRRPVLVRPGFVRPPYYPLRRPVLVTPRFVRPYHSPYIYRRQIVPVPVVTPVPVPAPYIAPPIVNTQPSLPQPDPFHGLWQVVADHVTASLVINQAGYSMDTGAVQQTGGWQWTRNGSYEFVFTMKSPVQGISTFRGKWIIPGQQFQIVSDTSGVQYTVTRQT